MIAIASDNANSWDFDALLILPESRKNKSRLQLGESRRKAPKCDAEVRLASDVFSPRADIFPLTPIVNKVCNIECSVNNMLQIIQNMMVSQG